MPISPYIRFKTLALLTQWDHGYRDKNENLQQIHPAIKAIITAAAYRHYQITGKPLVITSLYRPGEGSVHNYGRGFDGRVWNIPPTRRQEWVDWINDTFPYGDAVRMTALIHDSGQGEHIHGQVSFERTNVEIPESYITG